MYDARAGGSKNGLVCSLVRVYSHVRAHYTQDWTLGTLWGQTMFQESGRDLSPLDAPAVQYIELSGNGRRVASMDSHGTLSIFDMAKIGIAANRSGHLLSCKLLVHQVA